MGAVVLRKEAVAPTTSPPHASATVPGHRADAARAKLETGYRRPPAPDWLLNAIAWAAGRGGRSGRVAWQFIQDLAGSLGKTLA